MAAQDTAENVRRDAMPDCRVCFGQGWHWGWDFYRRPVMLRCPCVDSNRANAIPNAERDTADIGLENQRVK